MDNHKLTFEIVIAYVSIIAAIVLLVFVAYALFHLPI